MGNCGLAAVAVIEGDFDGAVLIKPNVGQILLVSMPRLEPVAGVCGLVPGSGRDLHCGETDLF